MCPGLADNDRSLYLISRGADVWRVRRSPTGSGLQAWSQPERVPVPVSSPQAEFSCHVSSPGNLWTCSHRPGGVADAIRFASIQAAVDYAEPGQVILLSPGTYNENPILPDFPLMIRSTHPLDSAPMARTILAGDKGSPVVRLMPGTAIRSLQGLTITGGEDGIVFSGARLQVSACVIKGRLGTAVDVKAGGGAPEAGRTGAK